MAVRIMLALILLSSSAGAQSLEAGVWKATTVVDLNGVPLPPANSEECVSSEDAQDVKTTIAKELKKKHCALTKWTVKGDKLEATLRCDGDGLRAEGALTGTIAKKSYELSGRAKGSFKGIPCMALLKLSGAWVKMCTP